MSIIEVKKLNKIFIRHKKKPGLANSLKGLFSREKITTKAVDEISFNIDEGEIVGFLGPNGAGKTTTLKMLSGILYPTSGEIKVNDFIPSERKNEFKKSIGLVMGQKQQLMWDLPAADSFELFKEIYQIPDKQYTDHLNRLTKLLDVTDFLNIQVRQLSLGQRMKMEIIAALIHKPKILFLDEPTLGLDVVSQQNIREFFRAYNQEEKVTILLTSHYMEDIKALCNRVLIINQGKLVYDDLLEKLTKEKIKTKTVKILLTRKTDESLSQFGKVIKHEGLYSELEISNDQIADVLKTLVNTFPIEDITIEDPEAEEIIRNFFQDSKNDISG